jgi:hypothetical protein
MIGSMANGHNPRPAALWRVMVECWLRCQSLILIRQHQFGFTSKLCTQNVGGENWLSSTAFGGTNDAIAPVGAVSHTEEPGLNRIEKNAIYFGIWANGKNFAVCT